MNQLTIKNCIIIINMKLKQEKQMKKLKKQTMALIICEAIMSISKMFLDTFLVAYFFQLTNQNITVISIYYIISYSICGAIFWLGGDIIKTKNQIKVFQCGMIINCIYILVIGLLGEKCKAFYYLLGILFGVSQGIYWLAAHALRTKLIPFEDTKGYVSIQGIISQVIKIVFPIVIGTSIELTSFKEVAILIFGLTIIQVIASTKLKQSETKVEGFNLLHYMKKIRNLGKKAKGVRNSYKLAFYEGINNSLLSTLITIIIMMTFQTSFNLGALTTLFSILAIIANMIYKQHYKNKYAKSYIIICTILPVLSVLGFLVGINKITVVIYNLINAIFITILTNIKSTQRYNCMNVEELENDKIEHQSMYEIVLAIGRVTGYFVLLMVGLLNNIFYFKLLLLIVTLTFIPSSIQLYKISKQETIN